MWPKNLLMIEPNGFDIKYSINPYMSDEQGALKKIDHPLATRQWNALKALYARLGLNVHTLPGQPDLPDMVFCANPFFPFFKDNRLQIIGSNMRSPYRQAEVGFIKDWALKLNCEFYELPPHQNFEGMGDALWNYETQEIYGGYGFRTDRSIYDMIENIVERPVIRLRLVDERFYHMDTCLSILNRDTALVVPSAFTEEGMDLLKAKFENLIEVPLEEALHFFAGNAFCVDGKNVVIQQGAHQTILKLLAQGFKVHAMDTSEFIKSGGSVFCLKMLF